MTHVQDNRCFGRLKAQELSEAELAMVGGGDVSHHFACWNQVSEGNGTQGCYAIGYGYGFCSET